MTADSRPSRRTFIWGAGAAAAGTAALAGGTVAAPASAAVSPPGGPGAAATRPGAIAGSPPAIDQAFSARELLFGGTFDVAGRSSGSGHTGGYNGCPIGWSVLGNAEAARTVNLSADRTEGLSSLEITNPAGSSVTVASDYVIAVAGTAYTATANLRGSTGTSPALTLDFRDYNDTVLAAFTSTPDLSTSFQTVTVQGTAPDGTAHLTVAIAAADAGVSYWDQVTLAAAAPAYDPALGTTRELFLDDYRIDSMVSVGRVVHPALKRPEPVLRPDQPWEGTASYIYGSVHRVNGLYRMWYTCVNDVSPGYYLAYAESRDGVKWTKPAVGSIGYKDIPAAQTNMVMPGGGTVAYNPGAPADRRYAALVYQAGTVNVSLGYYAFFSPDGYTWTSAQSAPVLLDGDVSNVTWDAGSGKYIASIKKRMFTSRTPGIYNRSAFIATSDDFLTWTTPQLGVEGDDADNGLAESMAGLEGQIYGMPVLPYESGYVGLPWIFLITDYSTGVSGPSAGDGPVTPQVAFSRDLATWSRPVRDYVLQPGGPGAWDSGTLYTSSTAQTDEESVTIYYGGFNVWHGGVVASGDPARATQVGQVGMATWRRDGFVSVTNAAVNGAGSPGTLTSRPVTFTGSKLHVNAAVRPGGSLTVAVLDTSGAVIDGYSSSAPVRGDRLDAVVTWPGGRTLGQLKGEPVALRFTLSGADLYSYWVSA